MIAVIWHNKTIDIKCQPEAAMPWNKEHKGATRERILESASSAIRGRGVAGVGVKDVMDAAGVTHGGFYAHFGSKEEVVADAFAFACTQSAAVLGKVADRAPPAHKILSVPRASLRPSHAPHPDRG